jgi:hypothetical protein
MNESAIVVFQLPTRYIATAGTHGPPPRPSQCPGQTDGGTKRRTDLREAAVEVGDEGVHVVVALGRQREVRLEGQVLLIVAALWGGWVSGGWVVGLVGGWLSGWVVGCAV